MTRNIDLKTGKKDGDTLSPLTYLFHNGMQSGGNPQQPAFYLGSEGFRTQFLLCPTEGYHPRDRCPNHLALKVEGACIHKSHRTIAKKEAFVERHINTCHSCPLRV